MDTVRNLEQELKNEYQITKKFIENFPDGKNDYQPHEKSEKLMPLATHVVEIFGWPDFMMNTEKLDFAAGDYQPTVLNSKQDLLNLLDDGYKKSTEVLAGLKTEDLENRWKMTNGDEVLADFNKYEAIRHALNQITHHRAQLGVYYRLNDIPLPASYGPSADSHNF